MPKAEKKVLVIEDEKAIAHALELKLNRAGFEAKVVFNGEDGLNSLKKEKFDLVILDLIMPKMDGFSVLQRLKEENAKIPVIVISNLGQEEDLKRAKELGAREYFIKANTPIADIVEHIQQELLHT